MDNNNIMGTNNNIMDTNITNIKSIKKKHSFKKKKKARPILSQHGGAKYYFNKLIGIKSEGNMSCWLDSGLQLLWNIDCLREYLLTPTSEENINKFEPITEKAKESENIIELVTNNNNNPNLLSIFSKDPAITETINKTIDKIDGKINAILALKSIFKTYNDAVKSNSDTAVLDKNLTFKNSNNEDAYTVDTFYKYMIGEVIKDTGSDPAEFISKVFGLFVDISNTKVINLRKCFTSRVLNIYANTHKYEIVATDILYLRPNQEDNGKNIQLLIDERYINNEESVLIPFKETKFILLGIQRPPKEKEVSIVISPNIIINKETYKLRGTIVAPRTIDTFHFSYYACDDNGKITAFLNGTNKSSYVSQSEEDKRNNNPETKGFIYLYELIQKATTEAELAEELASAIAVAGVAEAGVADAKANTSQPDTNVAAALTATLAATQVGPDAIEEANVPAALTATLAATQLPAPTQPPQPPASASAKPAGRGRGAGNGRGNGSGNGSGNVDRQRSLGSGFKGSAKPPVKNQDEVKPYSGSLEPSSDSNGENMVLGILLVITLAISGVLFVQH